MTISIPTTTRDKRDKKLRADKSSLKATKNKNTGISTGTKKPKAEKKVEKQPIPIAKLRAAYGILCNDQYPEADDEDKERKQLIKAIKKALK